MKKKKISVTNRECIRVVRVNKNAVANRATIRSESKLINVRLLNIYNFYLTCKMLKLISFL